MFKRILFVLLAGCLSTAAFAQAKPRIEKAADMPRFSYKIDGKLEDLVRDEAAFRRFAEQVRRDDLSVLDGYEIADKSAHRDLLTVLAQIDFLEGRYAEAAKRAEGIRALEEKPADKLVSGMGIRTMVAAEAKVGNVTSEAYRQEVGRQIAAEYPYPVIANDIKSYNRSAEIIGEALLLGGIRDQLQPVVDKAGGVLSSDFAPAIVLPNLLTVGAVDIAGDEAPFTSYGPTVKAHANGYQVVSYLPGGERVAFSGTSMASLQVAGLAGKMLAVNPKLTPPEVIAIIEKTLDKTEDSRRFLVHPARAVAAAQAGAG